MYGCGVDGFYIFVAMALVVGGGALAWVGRAYERGAPTPQAAWERVLALWRHGSLEGVKRCLTPESVALLEYGLSACPSEAKRPELPEDLVLYLGRLLQREPEELRPRLDLIVEAVRGGVVKHWLRAPPPSPVRQPAREGASPPPPEDLERLLLLMLEGIPTDLGPGLPRVTRILETCECGTSEYARVVFEPIFAGFGIFDTYKQVHQGGWKLDVAAPLLQAAEAHRVQAAPVAGASYTLVDAGE